jgi:hypothetical protein
MKRALLALILAVAPAAFAQSTADLDCTTLTGTIPLRTTLCTFSDGTGEILETGAASAHVQQFSNPQEWAKLRSDLIAMDNAYTAEQMRRADGQEAEIERWRAEEKADAAAQEKRIADAVQRDAQREKASAIHRKKECVAAGFQWSSGMFGVCTLKDESK